MSTVFVTGGSGFVGSHLIKLLAAQHFVKCLVRPSTLARLSPDLRSLKSVEWVSGDLSDPQLLADALNNVEQVYHVAGLTKAIHDSDFQEVNDGGTRRLLQACAISDKAKRVLVVSSLAAAGPSLDGSPRMESQPAEPVSIYGRSKLAAEQVAQAFVDRLRITIVRPPIVLGPGDRDGFEMFRAIHRTGLHIVPSLNDYRVSLIHVADLAFAIQKLMECGESLSVDETPGQGIYYVAVDDTPTYADLGRHVGKALGRDRTKVIHVATNAIFGIAAVSTFISRIIKRPSILNVDKIREAAAGHWICSVKSF